LKEVYQNVRELYKNKLAEQVIRHRELNTN